MSQSSDILTEGFAALLSSNGEAMTFRELSVVAVVNRNIEDPQYPRQPNFSTRLSTEVEILKSAVASVPLAGESFDDGDGYRHRVQLVASRGICWICRCEVSKIP